MGLMDWLKKPSVAQTASPQSAASPASDGARAGTGAVLTPPEVSTAHLDELVAQSRAGKPGAMEALWGAVYALPRWHFVARMDESKPLGESVPQPFCGVIDGRPMLFAFTSSERAHQFAVKRGLAMANGAFPTLSIERDGAIALAMRLTGQGLQAVVFDEQVGGGFFAPIANLVPMYAHCLRVPLAEAGAKFGLDPIRLLTERAVQSRQPQHVEELFSLIFRLETLWFVDDNAVPGKPAITALEGGQIAVPLFTSQEEAVRGGAILKAAGTSVANLLEIRAGTAWELLESMHGLGVAVAALNVSLPVRLEEIELMRARVGRSG